MTPSSDVASQCPRGGGVPLGEVIRIPTNPPIKVNLLLYIEIEVQLATFTVFKTKMKDTDAWCVPYHTQTGSGMLYLSPELSPHQSQSDRHTK